MSSWDYFCTLIFINGLNHTKSPPSSTLATFLNWLNILIKFCFQKILRKKTKKLKNLLFF